MTRPEECPGNHVEHGVDFPKNDKVPIIDLFLNPVRTEELVDMLSQSEDSAIRTKVNKHTDVFFWMRSLILG